MDFSALSSELDAQVYQTLGDAATLNERPIQGLFEQDSEQAQFGKLRTGLSEPRFVIRAQDLQTTERGARLVVDLPPPEGGAYRVVEIRPHRTGEIALILRPES